MQRFKEQVTRVGRWVSDTLFVVVFVAPWMIGLAILLIPVVAPASLQKSALKGIVAGYVKQFAAEEDGQQ